MLYVSPVAHRDIVNVYATMLDYMQYQQLYLSGYYGHFIVHTYIIVNKSYAPLNQRREDKES